MSSLLARFQTSLIWFSFGASVVLICPAAASAGCDGTWDVSGRWTIVQTNGYRVGFEFQQSGNGLAGMGHYVSEGDGWPVSFSGYYDGALSGTVSGSNIDFTIDWGGGGVGVYSGRVDDAGGVSGRTYDKTKPSASAAWQGDHNAKCISIETSTPPAPRKSKSIRARSKPPAAPEAEVPASATATVTNDVDLYDSPGGSGNVIGTLNKGDTVPFGGCRDDHWCQVTGRGWVWVDFLEF